MRLLRTSLTLESFGADEIDAGPVLLAGNHTTALDAAIVRAALPPALARRTLTATTPAQVAHGLRRGRVVLVFPEGPSCADGELADFDPAAFEPALAAGVGVRPVAIRGAYAAVAPGERWPAPGRPRVAVRFGRPVVADTAAGVADQVRFAIAALLREDATSWWQVRRHEAGEVPIERPAAWRRIWQQTRPPTVGRTPPPREIWGS